MRQNCVQLREIVYGSQFGGALHGLQLLVSLEIKHKHICCVCYCDNFIENDVRS